MQLQQVPFQLQPDVTHTQDCRFSPQTKRLNGDSKLPLRVWEWCVSPLTWFCFSPLLLFFGKKIYFHHYQNNYIYLLSLAYSQYIITGHQIYFVHLYVRFFQTILPNPIQPWEIHALDPYCSIAYIILLLWEHQFPDAFVSSFTVHIGISPPVDFIELH